MVTGRGWCAVRGPGGTVLRRGGGPSGLGSAGRGGSKRSPFTRPARLPRAFHGAAGSGGTVSVARPPTRDGGRCDPLVRPCRDGALRGRAIRCPFAFDASAAASGHGRGPAHRGRCAASGGGSGAFGRVVAAQARWSVRGHSAIRAGRRSTRPQLMPRALCAGAGGYVASTRGGGARGVFRATRSLVTRGGRGRLSRATPAAETLMPAGRSSTPRRQRPLRLARTRRCSPRCNLKLVQEKERKLLE